MHLARTGAFLRALRNARLEAPRLSPGSSTQCQRWITHSSRCLTSLSAFPQQSVSDPDEVDPRKTAATASQVRQDGLSQTSIDSAGDDSGARLGKSILGQHYPSDTTTNVTDTILALVGRKLYDTPNHPIAITRRLIESVFPPPVYKNRTATNPVVSTKDNFDILGFPDDHPGRSRTDTYYVDSKTVLRTHTSAHQHSAFQNIAGDP